MENLSTYNFSISRLKEYFPAASRTGIGEDLCLLNVRFDENIHPLEHPFRFDGVLLLYCIKGNMRMSINLNEYDITDNSLILCTPQNILKVADIPYPEKKSLHYVVIAMSQKFASELRLDFKRIISEGMPLAEAPVATLSEDAKEMVARYLELVAGVSKSDMKLKDEAFLEELRALQADLQIVVAFRMLPEVVWNMPPMGTFNLHAALLPQYRGAAPINWAVINGDTETGITTFFLKHEIDTGDIIQQVRVPIADSDNVEIVYDKLMMFGGDLMLDTVDAILAGTM